MNKNIFAVLALNFILGCSLFPGGDISLKNKVIISEKNTSEKTEQQVVDSDNTNVYTITSSLIENLKNAAAYRQSNSAKQRVALPTDKAKYRYRIGAGDMLSINVWHEELLTGDEVKLPPNTPVDNKGNIYYPHVGSLSVAGKTISQVRRSIANKLKKYLKDPQVEVRVVGFESKKVYVTGEVKNPGVLKLTTTPITIMDALNLSGGLSDKAQWNRVTLNRKNATYPVPLISLLQEGNLRYNYLLQDGDILNIPRNDKDKVYLMGEVIKPQTVTIGRYGLSLTAALSAAGGINEKQADPTGIFVIRNEQQKTFLNIQITRKNIYQLNAKDMTALALGEQFQLMPGDVVYVTAAPIAKWNRVISNIMPSLSGIGSVNGIVR